MLTFVEDIIVEGIIVLEIIVDYIISKIGTYEKILS